MAQVIGINKKDQSAACNIAQLEHPTLLGRVNCCFKENKKIFALHLPNTMLPTPPPSAAAHFPNSLVQAILLTTSTW